MSNKNPGFDAKNLRCVVCGGKRGLIHKYGLKMCRRCFRENAPSIGFNKYS